MQQVTVEQLATHVAGRVVKSKSGTRIVVGRATLAWINERKTGLQLDLAAADVAGASAKARKPLTVNSARGRACTSTATRRPPRPC